MPHAIDCPACGGHLKIPDGIWEKRVHGQVAHLNCKKCKHPIEVDGRTEEQKAQAALPPAAPAKPEAPPAKPEAGPAKPEDEPRKPEAELAKPEAKLAKPEADLAKPEAKLAKPEAKLAKRDAGPAKRDAEPAKRDAEPAKREDKAPVAPHEPEAAAGSKPEHPKPVVPKLALQPRRPEIRPKTEAAPKLDLRGARADVTPRPLVTSKRGSKPDITPKPDEVTVKLPDVAPKPAHAPKPVEARALGNPLVPKLGPSPERATKPEIPKPALRESTPDTPLAKLGIKSDPPPDSIPADSADIIAIPPSEPLPRFPPPKPREAQRTLPDWDPSPKPALGQKKPPPKPEVIRESDLAEPAPPEKPAQPPPAKPAEPKKPSERPKASERPKGAEEKRRSVRPVALDSNVPDAPVVAAEAPSVSKGGRGLTIALIVAAAVAFGWWVLRPRAQAPVEPRSAPPATASVAPSATATPPPTSEATAKESATPPEEEPPAPAVSAEEPKKAPKKKRRSVRPLGTRYVPSSI